MDTKTDARRGEFGRRWERETAARVGVEDDDEMGTGWIGTGAQMGYIVTNYYFVLRTGHTVVSVSRIAS